jgi:hypothetical protein
LLLLGWALVICIFSSLSQRALVGALVFLLLISLLIFAFFVFVTLFVDSSDLTEFFVAEHLVGVVVQSAEDSLNVLSARVEAVLLQEENQIWHTDGVVTASDGVESLVLHEVVALAELLSGLSSLFVKAKLLVKKSHE